MKNDGGRTALHYAASKGWLKVAEILMSHGANMNAKDKVSNRTIAFLYTCSFGPENILCCLFLGVAQLLDMCMCSFQVGSTPLHRAASMGNSQMCELLIEEGAEVDPVDKAGQTPLMVAVICYNREVCLLDNSEVVMQFALFYTELMASCNFTCTSAN